MAELISTMVPTISSCPLFTVDTTVDEVSLPNAAAPNYVYSGDQFANKFAAGDNIFLLSLGYWIPERFVMWGYDPAATFFPVITCRLNAEDQVTMATNPLEQFGKSGILVMPFPNYEMSVGVYVDAASAIGTNPFKLKIEFPYSPGGADLWSISMIDVPAALHGKQFRVVPFIKVMHNFPLTL